MPVTHQRDRLLLLLLVEVSHLLLQILEHLIYLCFSQRVFRVVRERKARMKKLDFALENLLLVLADMSHELVTVGKQRCIVIAVVPRLHDEVGQHLQDCERVWLL